MSTLVLQDPYLDRQVMLRPFGKFDHCMDMPSSPMKRAPYRRPRGRQDPRRDLEHLRNVYNYKMCITTGAEDPCNGTVKLDNRRVNKYFLYHRRVPLLPTTIVNDYTA